MDCAGVRTNQFVVMISAARNRSGNIARTAARGCGKENEMTNAELIKAIDAPEVEG